MGMKMNEMLCYEFDCFFRDEYELTALNVSINKTLVDIADNKKCSMDDFHVILVLSLVIAQIIDDYKNLDKNMDELQLDEMRSGVTKNNICNYFGDDEKILDLNMKVGLLLSGINSESINDLTHPLINLSIVLSGTLQLFYRFYFTSNKKAPEAATSEASN